MGLLLDLFGLVYTVTIETGGSIPVEALATLETTPTDPVEAGSTAQTEGSIPVESSSIATLVTDGSIPVEWSATTARVSGGRLPGFIRPIPVEPECYDLGCIDLVITPVVGYATGVEVIPASVIYVPDPPPQEIELEVELIIRGAAADYVDTFLGYNLSVEPMMTGVLVCSSDEPRYKDFVKTEILPDDDELIALL